MGLNYKTYTKLVVSGLIINKYIHNANDSVKVKVCNRS